MQVFKNAAATIALLALALFSACCSTTTHERAWIGGHYEEVNSQLPDTEQAIGLLLTDVFAHTPVNEAGMLPGDVLLQLNTSHIESKDDLAEYLDRVQPGEVVTLHLLRELKRIELECVLGRETYLSRNFIGLFPISLHVDLWPFDGDFSIFGLVSVAADDDRRDLLSPSEVHANRCLSGR